jgi:hypothetical protein
VVTVVIVVVAVIFAADAVFLLSYYGKLLLL